MLYPCEHSEPAQIIIKIHKGFTKLQKEEIQNKYNITIEN